VTKTLAFYPGNNLTLDYGDKFITLGYKIIRRRRNNTVYVWVVKAWRSEDVALYGKVVSPPSPNSQ